MGEELRVIADTFEQADPTVGPTGTQGARGLYQCRRCKTLSIGAPTDPATRS